MAASGEPRNANGILVGLGAAVGEKEHVDVARADGGQLLPQLRARFGGHERVGVGQRRRLILNGLDHARIAVADVDAHQLAVEVDEALALGRPEVDALRFRHGDGIDVRLGRPLIERVLLAERHHFLSGHRVSNANTKITKRSFPSCWFSYSARVSTASANTFVAITISAIEQYSSG